MIRNKHTEWAKYINFIEDCFNNTVHEITSFTPLELQKNEKSERFWDKYVDKFISTNEKLDHKEKVKICFNRIRSKAEKRADEYNKKHKITKLTLNDSVLIKANNMSSAQDKTISKFFSIFKGPYIVAKVHNNNTYLIKNSFNKNIGTFHISSI